MNKAKVKWPLLMVATLVVAGGVILGGRAFLSKKRPTPISSNTVATTPTFNACQYLTNKEAGVLLGQTIDRAPVNRDNSGTKDIQTTTCEYNQGALNTLIITIARGQNPEAISRERSIATQPIESTSEQPYTMLGQTAIITREYTGQDGQHVMASARFVTPDGSIQINAATFDIVQKAAAALLPRVDS